MKFDTQSTNGAFATYQSSRVVRAAQITKIHGSACVGVGPDFFSVSYDPNGKPTPVLGWYVIAYDDGYVSFCPPEQFEKGYRHHPAPSFVIATNDRSMEITGEKITINDEKAQ